MTSVLLIAWQAAHFEFMTIWFINRTTHHVVKSSRKREFPPIFIESTYVQDISLLVLQDFRVCHGRSGWVPHEASLPCKPIVLAYLLLGVNWCALSSFRPTASTLPCTASPSHCCWRSAWCWKAQFGAGRLCSGILLSDPALVGAGWQTGQPTGPGLKLEKSPDLCL